MCNMVKNALTFCKYSFVNEKIGERIGEKIGEERRGEEGIIPTSFKVSCV